MTGDEERDELVAELEVRHRLAFVVTRVEEEREDVAAAGAVASSAANLAVEELVASADRGAKAAVVRERAEIDLQERKEEAGPRQAFDLLRSLEPRAAAAGGRVIFTLGNHEAEFLYAPENDKATNDDGVDLEIRAWGLTPVGLADGSDVRGKWLRDRPFAARIGSWFFAHAGNTHGRSIADLERAIRAGITAHDYADGEAIGGDSILEAREWYAGSESIAASYASAVGARHIVFGHQPDALGARGEIAVAFGGALFRIDCGMTPHVDDSHGKLLRIRREGSIDIAESLSPDGSAREIWRGS